MAYVIESLPSTTNTAQAPYGIKLSSNNGLFTTLYDVNQQAKENLKTLLLTNIGERYMLPTFGSKLLSILFQPNVDELKPQIVDILVSTVNTWLPYINIDDIVIKTGNELESQDNTVSIKLSYSVLNFSPASITISATADSMVTIA